MAQPVIEADSGDYLRMFHFFVKRSIAQLREQARSAGFMLNNDDREQALRTLDFALKIKQVAPSACRLLIEIASSMEQAGLRKEWIAYLVKGLEQSKTLNNRLLESELSYHLGMLYQLQARYEEAHDYLVISLEGFRSIGVSARQARSLNRLGHVARIQRKYDEANKYVEEALLLIGKRSTGREFSYYVKGMIALEEGKPNLAADWFHQSIAICEKTQNKRMIAQRLLVLIVALYEQGCYDEAILYGTKAVQLFQEINDPVQKALAEMNLGNVHLLEGNPKHALDNYKSAEPVLQHVSDELHLAMIYVNQGIALRMLNEWERAEQFLMNGVERWRRLGNARFLTDALDDLGLLYYSWKQYDKAISAFNEGLAILQNLEQSELHVLRQSLEKHRIAVISEAQTLHHRISFEH